MYASLLIKVTTGPKEENDVDDFPVVVQDAFGNKGPCLEVPVPVARIYLGIVSEKIYLSPQGALAKVVRTSQRAVFPMLM